MNATTPKTTVSSELIELKNEKKELKKLEKLIEAEVNNLDFELSKETLDLINDNLEISETMKQLRKKQLNNSKYIFMNINNRCNWTT